MPSADEAGGSGGPGSPSSTTICCPGWPGSTRRCSWSSAAPPARASRPWSTAWSGRRSARPGCCGRPPARRCWSATRTTCAGSARGELLPGLIRTAGVQRRPAHPAARRGPGARPRAGLPGRARHRLGGRPQPRARRAAARRRRPVAVRHHRRALRRRRAVGAADHRPAARHGDRPGAGPGAARGRRRDRRPPERDAGRARPGRGAAVRAAGDRAGRAGPAARRT